MPQLTLPLDPVFGPLLDTEVGFPASAKQPASGTPPRQTVKFLIDTGASTTSISPDTAVKLGLPILGLKPVRSTTQSVTVNEYLADLFIPLGNPPIPLRDWRLLEFATGGSWGGSIGGLLGRDFLQHAIFHVNGPAKIFTISV